MQQNFRAPIEVAGRSAPEIIFRRLSEAIATGELRPGDRLPSEAELASSLGVAPMTLRRALETLRDLSLIETRRGRQGGNFVSAEALDHLSRFSQTIPVTRQDIRELTDWRRAISGEACFLAAQRADSSALEDIVSAGKAFDCATTDANTMRMADVQLHLAIAQASNSKRLHAEENQIQVELTKLMTVSLFSEAARTPMIGSHDPLIQAIVLRQPELARQEALSHVEETFNWIVSLAKI